MSILKDWMTPEHFRETMQDTGELIRPLSAEV